MPASASSGGQRQRVGKKGHQLSHGSSSSPGGGRPLTSYVPNAGWRPVTEPTSRQPTPVASWDGTGTGAKHWCQYCCPNTAHYLPPPGDDIPLTLTHPPVLLTIYDIPSGVPFHSRTLWPLVHSSIPPSGIPPSVIIIIPSGSGIRYRYPPSDLRRVTSDRVMLVLATAQVLRAVDIETRVIENNIEGIGTDLRSFRVRHRCGGRSKTFLTLPPRS
eukprot:scaffold101432_cov33-Tisochrysis_lutea.AAC.1